MKLREFILALTSGLTIVGLFSTLIFALYLGIEQLQKYGSKLFHESIFVILYSVILITALVWLLLDGTGGRRVK